MLNTARPAGDRNNRVTFERNTPSTDANGQQVESWGTLCSRWVAIEQVNGAETFKNHRIKADITDLVYCPYDETTSTLTTKDRITWNGRTLAIEAIYDAETRHYELQLHCKNRV